MESAVHPGALCLLLERSAGTQLVPGRLMTGGSGLLEEPSCGRSQLRKEDPDLIKESGSPPAVPGTLTARNLFTWVTS